ncbi:hypothetical protein CLOM_g23408 [Closterium sp. NIES-68]|nr:hypothetical protein CLOM_g23408 [Closterium sp. NIES-68]GJP72985.1 hypothetical protein CLOP_g3750 [Closterium sp. NIES-67]
MAAVSLLRRLCAALAFAIIAASFTLPALADVTSTGVTSAAVTSAASRVAKRANEARRLLPGAKARSTGGDGGSNGSSGVDVAAILEEHNKARQEVGVPGLSWDEGVALAAQQWAAELASSGCNLEHGGADGFR